MKAVILSAFRKASDLGELRPGLDPAMATNVCVGAMTGLLTEWLRLNESFDMDGAAELTLTALFARFRASEGARLVAVG